VLFHNIADISGIEVVIFKAETCRLKTEINYFFLTNMFLSFDVLLTVHLSMILVMNQLNAQNLVL